MKTSVKLGKVTLTSPNQVYNDWYSWYEYKELTEETMGVYILFGVGEKVLYVGYSTQLRKRIETQVNRAHFKDEIVSIHYIIFDKQLEAINMEKILYFLLKPKYSMKKIFPKKYYTMRKIQQSN